MQKNWIKAICQNDFNVLISIVVSANGVKYSFSTLTQHLLFYTRTYICNFGDVNSIYSIEANFKQVKTILKKSFEHYQVWFFESHMVLNPEKIIANESVELVKKTLHTQTEKQVRI